MGNQQRVRTQEEIAVDVSGAACRFCTVAAYYVGFVFLPFAWKPDSPDGDCTHDTWDRSQTLLWVFLGLALWCCAFPFLVCNGFFFGFCPNSNAELFEGPITSRFFFWGIRMGSPLDFNFLFCVVRMPPGPP